jgi:hypothetical protein
VVVIAAVLCLGLAAAALVWAAPSAGEGQANEIVSALPYQQIIRYEDDPFRQGQIKQSTQSLQSIILVYADGHTKVKRVE